MTEKIQHIIDGIRLKCKTLYYQLESERSIRDVQAAELSILKGELALLNSASSELERELEALKLENETMIRQMVEEKGAVKDSKNEEIDHLVREIEHCINQLKQ
jgi:hypothetical protein